MRNVNTDKDGLLAGKKQRDCNELDPDREDREDSNALIKEMYYVSLSVIGWFHMELRATEMNCNDLNESDLCQNDQAKK